MQNDITQATRTDIAGTITDYEVDTEQTEGINADGETYSYNNDFSKWYGYYKTIPEVKKPIDNYATWVLGRGYTTDTASQVLLDNIMGVGGESFLDILWNGMVVKKFNGRSYTQIIKDGDLIINLKPLDPASMKTVFGRDGLILRHEQISKIPGNKPKKFKPNEMFYLVNDRVADNNAGTSVIEACEWIILARNEAMADWKRISHRSTIRVLYVDENDKTRLANLKAQYANSKENDEVLILTCKKGDAEFQDLTLPPVESFLAWIRYLENAFYKAIGFPKSLTGDAEGIPESGGKMAYFNHMPIYNKEVTELEADIFNQLGIEIKFNRQDSLTDNMQTQEGKNNAQTGFQPQDTKI